MPLVPSYIQNLSIYVPGKSIDQLEREGIKNIYKLASNENSLGPSPKAIEAIKKSLKDIHRYPDMVGYDLRTKLAKKFNVKMNNVILGAGSEGIMSTIMRTFLLNDDELISAENSFIGFRVLANASGKKVNWVPMNNYKYDLEAMAEKVTEYTKIIYIANPDNPMGTYINRKDFDAFYKHIPERVLIILDEAYFEFAEYESDYPDSMTYRYDNVITLRTFSKAYGLAGLRIGYGFAHDTLISNLMKVKEPFEPSLIALTGGMAAMDDHMFLKDTLLMNKAGYIYFKKELEGLGIKTIPSVANFITTIWDTEDRAEKITASLLKKGIIVRNLHAFGWPKCIRISIGTDYENQKVIANLRELLA
jgi:histidinol-phosphate aminotransferase|tara:strand:+ start:4402 stop:5487 length:1086 start_codon:yes stop_codon:yes gene_type:complete